MRSLPIYAMLISLSLTSCKSDNHTPKTHQFPGPPPVSLMDKDRDGISDPYEIQQSTSENVATFPSFSLNDRIETNLVIKEKTMDAKAYSWSTNIDKDVNSIYRANRVRMAKLSYDRKFKDSNEEISFTPLPSFQLTEIVFHQWSQLKSLSVEKHPTLSISSKLPLKLKDFSGIEEIINISGRVGFFKNSIFIPLTNRFILKDEVGKAISLGLKKEDEVSYINLEIVDPELIKRVLESESQLVLKLDDYEAKTLEKSKFTFSKQWSHASSLLRPFIVSDSDEDRIYLVNQNLSFKDALTQINKDFTLYENGTLKSLNTLGDETLSNSTLGEMDSQQLKERSWHSFIQSNLFAVAHLSQVEIAQAAKHIIIEGEKEIKKIEDSFRLENIRIGETLILKYQGSYSTPYVFPRTEEIKDVAYTDVEVIEFVSTGPEPTFELPRRYTVDKITNCTRVLHEIQWSEHKIENSTIFRIANSSGTQFNLSELSENFNALPVFNEESGEYEIHFLIDEDFINEMGEEITIYSKDQRSQRELEIGTMASSCNDPMPSTFDFSAHFGTSSIQNIPQSSSIKLKILRKF